MAFCHQCGQEIGTGMNFCPGCGAAQTQLPVTVETTPVITAGQQSIGINKESNNYSIVIMSRGTCTVTNAAELVEDLLGYSAADARRILNALPCQAAQNLTSNQAIYLAQALTEYGMSVSIYCGDNVVDMSQHASSSVFDQDGNFITKAAAAFALLTAANRVNRFIRRPKRRFSISSLFVPRYRWTARPYRRRRPAPPPPPKSIWMIPPRAAAPRPHRAPAPKPPRGMHGRPGRGPAGRHGGRR